MRVAAIQMTSTPIVENNLKQAQELIQQAKSKNAKLVILPEMFAIMGENALNKIEVKEKFGNGKIQNFLSVQAQQNKVWLIGGTIPIACEESNKIRASCLVFDSQGLMVARYDKIHLYDADISPSEQYRESATTQPGTKAVIVNSPLGKIGLAICYDVRFPELFRALVNHGAEIFSLPSAFTLKTGEAHWELLARARAVENFCYVIGSCQGGKNSSTRKTYGHSIIVNPWGEVIAKISNTKPGVIYADIHREEIQSLRKKMPILKHQCEFKVICKN